MFSFMMSHGFPFKTRVLEALQRFACLNSDYLQATCQQLPRVCFQQPRQRHRASCTSQNQGAFRYTNCVGNVFFSEFQKEQLTYRQEIY